MKLRWRITCVNDITAQDSKMVKFIKTKADIFCLPLFELLYMLKQISEEESLQMISFQLLRNPLER